MKSLLFKIFAIKNIGNQLRLKVNTTRIKQNTEAQSGFESGFQPLLQPRWHASRSSASLFCDILDVSLGPCPKAQQHSYNVDASADGPAIQQVAFAYDPGITTFGLCLKLMHKCMQVLWSISSHPIPPILLRVLFLNIHCHMAFYFFPDIKSP